MVENNIIIYMSKCNINTILQKLKDDKIDINYSKISDNVYRFTMYETSRKNNIDNWLDDKIQEINKLEQYNIKNTTYNTDNNSSFYSFSEITIDVEYIDV